MYSIGPVGLMKWHWRSLFAYSFWLVFGVVCIRYPFKAMRVVLDTKRPMYYDAENDEIQIEHRSWSNTGM